MEQHEQHAQAHQEEQLWGGFPVRASVVELHRAEPPSAGDGTSGMMTGIVVARWDSFDYAATRCATHDSAVRRVAIGCTMLLHVGLDPRRLLASAASTPLGYIRMDTGPLQSHRKYARVC